MRFQKNSAFQNNTYGPTPLSEMSQGPGPYDPQPLAASTPDVTYRDLQEWFLDLDAVVDHIDDVFIRDTVERIRDEIHSYLKG